ncbi:TauD/TfdA family dioxygenase [Pseudomonas amygdali]|uniref:TauD/TfdA-like domain-containing protein n=1 Tax=Pseudomonas amygdali pv. hibisci TaxID=251723 RepID=A0AB34U892_PSEA0|nr:TauD/TfdA family dioxygenase [Pseudomonas amygdali]KPX55510.1 Uncharacterized protein ALO67_03961 [Pseudomonas amygdali pv. hibisci]RMN58661.1 hypothetical protein ALQ57_01151 [Pseudomonas amygdali pv. hibisci]UBT81297.1 TauD/TfdA family dioxygenase [Pseudomonas amygdali]
MSVADSNARLSACQSMLPLGVLLERLDDTASTLLVRATLPNMLLRDVLGNGSAELSEWARYEGAVLFRGFAVEGAEQFADAMTAFTGVSLEYEERSTPRTQVGEHVYTATEYPAREPIFLHNENAYASCWPQFLAFHCERPAPQGGAMILADTRRVYAGIPQELSADCDRRGLLYKRRFIDGIGYSWQQAFGVRDEEQLASVLQERGYQWYHEGDQLVVQRTSSWSTTHPQTNQSVWFNHGVFFNAMSLPQATRSAFAHLLGQDIYPFQTLYGDGCAIETATYSLLKGAYEQALYRVLLQPGDVLLIDNLVTAHGRDAYTGLRKHYVKMLA